MKKQIKIMISLLSATTIASCVNEQPNLNVQQLANGWLIVSFMKPPKGFILSNNDSQVTPTNVTLTLSGDGYSYRDGGYGCFYQRFKNQSGDFFNDLESYQSTTNTPVTQVFNNSSIRDEKDGDNEFVTNLKCSVDPSSGITSFTGRVTINFEINGRSYQYSTPYVYDTTI